MLTHTHLASSSSSAFLLLALCARRGSRHRVASQTSSTLFAPRRTPPSPCRRRNFPRARPGVRPPPLRRSFLEFRCARRYARRARDDARGDAGVVLRVHEDVRRSDPAHARIRRRERAAGVFAARGPESGGGEPRAARPAGARRAPCARRRRVGPRRDARRGDARRRARAGTRAAEPRAVPPGPPGGRRRSTTTSRR